MKFCWLCHALIFVQLYWSITAGVFLLNKQIFFIISCAQELELVEDVWRGEAQDLLSQITQLQAENKRLLVSLSLKDCPITEEDLQKQEGGLSADKVLEVLIWLMGRENNTVLYINYYTNLFNFIIQSKQLFRLGIRQSKFYLLYAITKGHWRSCHSIPG